jgi:hypothetical protein
MEQKKVFPTLVNSEKLSSDWRLNQKNRKFSHFVTEEKIAAKLNI